MMLKISGPLEHGFELGIVGRDAFQPAMQLVQLLAHLQHAAMGFHRPLEHSAVVALGGFLRQIAETGAARQHARTGIVGQLAEHDPDQRGLAGPVGADQRAAVTGRQHPVEVVEENAGTDRIAKIVELDHGRRPLTPSEGEPDNLTGAVSQPAPHPPMARKGTSTP